jgi:4-diphosphocytidyl-2-C-methyl-D-erythritol kinase
MSDRLAPVVRLAPAKLNLTLSVVGRRPDGYHALHTVMAPLRLFDRLSLAPAAGPVDTLHVTGADTGPTQDNLVLRAIAAAREAAARANGRGTPTVPLAARLEKHIPVAAGLAGGSSDAAAALDAALEAWSLEVPAGDRARAAASLGSDVPFFLAGSPALIEGRGEQVTPLPNLTGVAPGVLLVTPAVAVRTADAFAAFDAGGAAAPADPRSTRISSEHLVSELLGGLSSHDLVVRAGVLAATNDLAAAAFQLVPGLLQLRRRMSRILGVSIGLSGSGPTLWALYPSLDGARLAAEAVDGAFRRRDLEAPGSGAPSVIATELGGPPE